MSGKRSGEGMAGFWLGIDVIALVMPAIIKLVVLSGVAPCSKRADDTFKRLRRKIIPRQTNKTVFLAGSIPYKHPCVVSFIPRGIIGLQESELNNQATKTRCPGGGTPENSEQVTMQLNQLRMHVFLGKKPKI